MTAVEAPVTIPEAVDFLSHLHDGETGHLSLFAVDRRDGSKDVAWAELPDVAPIVRRAAELSSTHCVWVGVAPRRRPLPGAKRGRASDCLTIPGLWVDIDVAGEGHAADDLPPDMDSAYVLLRSFPMPPTALVDTGGGLQAYWQFLEPLPIGEADELTARWGATWVNYAKERGWGIDNVWDYARILRLPGTVNNKTSNPRPVRIVDADWGRRYGLDDIDQWLIDPPAPPPQRERIDVPWIGPQRPGDAFNASVDPAELLERVGCIFDHSDNGDRHYRAPHRTAKGDTTGITIYADGHTTIYSETFARQHGMETRRPYDPFGLYAHLFHGGSWRDATAALVDLGYGERPVQLADLIAPTGGATTADDAGEEAEDDWTRHDLAELYHGLTSGAYEPELPTHLEVIDGIPLLYPGRIHSIFGPPGGGKTWIALCAIVERLQAGEEVLMIDWEDSARGTVARLIELGCTAEDVARFDYRNPSSGLVLGIGRLKQSLAPWSLIVLDSTGESMAASGIDPNADGQVAQWMSLVKHLAKLGATVLLLDHVAKNVENRDMEIGSQRKQAAITGAAYRCDTVVEPAKGKDGKLKLVVRKDRLGNRPKGSTAAEVLFHAGDHLRIEIRKPEAQAAAERGEKIRPTHLMERVSRWLDFHPGATQNEVRREVSGNAEYLKKALVALIEEGYVRVDKVGQRYEHTVVKAYFESSDAQLVPVDNSNGDDRAHRAQTAPKPRPGRGEDDRAHRAPRLRESGGAGADHGSETDTTAPPVDNPVAMTGLFDGEEY